MFQSLRPNNQIYILKKDVPSLEVGSVVSVSNPIPKYPTNFGQPQETILDLVVKINGQDVPFQKIPANLDIADFGTSGVVIADNRNAMNSEIASLKQKSKDILNSIDYTSEDVITGLVRIDNTYYFRGNPLNNYFKLDDYILRIVGINSDNSIKRFQI